MVLLCANTANRSPIAEIFVGQERNKYYCIVAGSPQAQGLVVRSKNSGPGGTELEAGLFRDMRIVSGGQWWFQGSLETAIPSGMLNGHVAG